MRNGFSLARVLIAAFLLAAVAAACGSPGKAETYSASQILDRTRLAMEDVATFRMRGMATVSESYGPVKVMNTVYSEFQSPERFTHGDRFPTGEPGIEARRVGSQMFFRDSDLVWEEKEPLLAPNRNFTYGGEPLMNLNLDALQLVSYSDLTDDGIEVFRFQSTEQIEHPDRPGGPVSELFTKTVLVSKQTFRIVSKTDYKDHSRDTEGSSAVASWQYKYTVNYYDFNEPIVIEVPDSYIPWSSSVSLR